MLSLHLLAIPLPLSCSFFLLPSFFPPLPPPLPCLPQGCSPLLTLVFMPVFHSSSHAFSPFPPHALFLSASLSSESFTLVCSPLVILLEALCPPFPVSPLLLLSSHCCCCSVWVSLCLSPSLLPSSQLFPLPSNSLHLSSLRQAARPAPSSCPFASISPSIPSGRIRGAAKPSPTHLTVLSTASGTLIGTQGKQQTLGVRQEGEISSELTCHMGLLMLVAQTTGKGILEGC